MKTKLIASIAALALIAGLAGCSGNTADTSQPTESANAAVDNSADESSVVQAEVPQEPAASAANSQSSTAAPADGQSSTAASGTTITEAEAKAIALADAGLAETDVVFIRAHIDWDDGRQIYEVEFVSGNTEYDYDIDATSGEIVGYDTDIEDYTHNGGQPATAEVTVDEATAKQQALAKVEGATDADIRIHLDYDDGRPVYEGTIVHNERKYEFEIDATNGTMTEWSEESVYDD